MLWMSNNLENSNSIILFCNNYTLSLMISFFFFRAEEDARMSIRQGDKNHAAHYLRQKKRALKEVEAKDGQYQRLLELMQQLGRTKQNKQILDAYKAGAEAFKATLQRQGISPEEVCFLK